MEKQIKRLIGCSVFTFWVFFIVVAMAVVNVCALTAGIAHADIVWAPDSDDSYFQKHMEECTWTGDRSYTANSPTGMVTVYKSPEDSTVIDTMENGDDLVITYTCPDAYGNLWGCGPKYNVGWIPMDYLVADYDTYAFREEFASRIGEGLVYLSDEYTAEDICYWSYPGSSVLSMKFRADYGNSAFSSPFVDDAGRTWGHTSYNESMSGWVCLDDPTNETIYETMTDPAEAYYASFTWYTGDNVFPSATLITPDTSWQKIEIVLVAVAVIAVCGVSGGLLLMMRKRRRANVQNGFSSDVAF